MSRDEYRVYMMLAEANKCHSCERFREPYHQCSYTRILRILLGGRA